MGNSSSRGTKGRARREDLDNPNESENLIERENANKPRVQREHVRVPLSGCQDRVRVDDI